MSPQLSLYSNLLSLVTPAYHSTTVGLSRCFPTLSCLRKIESGAGTHFTRKAAPLKNKAAVLVGVSMHLLVDYLGQSTNLPGPHFCSKCAYSRLFHVDGL